VVEELKEEVKEEEILPRLAYNSDSSDDEEEEAGEDNQSTHESRSSEGNRSGGFIGI
jgi:hypothetical protein